MVSKWPTAKQEFEFEYEENVVEKLESTITKEQKEAEEQERYIQETTFEAKPSLWQRFKKSKFVRAATYVFRIKIKIELPDNALPEGRGE